MVWWQADACCGEVRLGSEVVNVAEAHDPRVGVRVGNGILDAGHKDVTMGEGGANAGCYRDERLAGIRPIEISAAVSFDKSRDSVHSFPHWNLSVE
ncbi:MAG: hypothetical protein JWL59_3515 [Chthoniobacteraceae bacterium]|nr:hypothetical protein [Chthoniobacteraceae bacterium]